MIKIITVAEMRAIEAAGDASGVSYDAMMTNAGRALANRVLAYLPADKEARVLVLVGSGNNGGDALVAARFIAAESQHQVSIYLYKPRPDSDANYTAVCNAGLGIIEAADDPEFATLKTHINTADLVIDGILGIGLHLPINGTLAAFMEAVQTTIIDSRQTTPLPPTIIPTAPQPQPTPRPYVIAVDCPSGLDCDTGAADDLTIPADETVTFEAVKVGQVKFPGAPLCGNLHVASIGLPDTLPARDNIPLEMPTAGDIKRLLPTLPSNAHKGSFGKLLALTGSINYVGAAALSAKAACYAGAGLVTVGTPQIIAPILAGQVPEATWLLLPHNLGVIAETAAPLVNEEKAAYHALLIGPGLGRDETTREFLLNVLQPANANNAHKHRIGFAPTGEPVAATPKPAEQHQALIIDADGLNLLSESVTWWDLLPAQTVITPHPGEMARLTGLDRTEVNAQRLTLAPEKAAEWGCVVLLKGAYTVIAAPDGRRCVLPFDEPALATAGTGDVLAGSIGALLAQGIPPYEAAIIGGYLHALAGRIAVQSVGTARSVTAYDVLHTIPAAMRQVEYAAY